MTLEPQKAPINKEKAASEERQHQTKDNQQQVQSEVEETAKKRTKIEKTAQQQHQAQPEVATAGLKLTLIPVVTEREGNVRGRRIAPEFTLNVSEAALMHMVGRPSDYIREVKREAFERIHAAERLLCSGSIVVIGKIPAGGPFDRWWIPFKVRDLWFALDYQDTEIREYRLMPALGPAPGDGGEPPPMTRRQRRTPPQQIGPRARRNGGDVQGARAARQPKPQPKAKGKKKRSDVKRIVNELYNLAVWELEPREEAFLHSLSQSWRQTKPRLLRSVVRMRRLGRACGSTLQDWRGAVASFVQATPIFTPFANFRSETLTRRSDVAPETFGPSGCLELSSVGQTVSSWLRLYSWKWDQPPIPWAEYLFGVDWTLNIFGAPEEEQAFA